MYVCFLVSFFYHSFFLQSGKPDLFITMTGDPGWPEIEKNKLPDSEWHSNPFLVNDVFHLKMQVIVFASSFIGTSLIGTS